MSTLSAGSISVLEIPFSVFVSIQNPRSSNSLVAYESLANRVLSASWHSAYLSKSVFADMTEKTNSAFSGISAFSLYEAVIM